MRARAAETAPDAGGVLIDRARFFRRGTSGAGAELLAAADLDRYRDRVAALAPPDLDGWLHRPSP
jgi:aryl sulfotransferase